MSESQPSKKFSLQFSGINIDSTVTELRTKTVLGCVVAAGISHLYLDLALDANYPGRMGCSAIDPFTAKIVQRYPRNLRLFEDRLIL